MNIQMITDMLQNTILALLATMALIQHRKIQGLEENACEMTKAIIDTRDALSLPSFPPEAAEEDKNEEHRCWFCKSWADCPACDTGVIYPCPYFKEEDYGEQE